MSDSDLELHRSNTPQALRYIQAVNKALSWALTSHSNSIVFGEDVALPGGAFGATKGLNAEFGSTRVFDTPISETAMLGMALGAAMTGSRPIVEIMYGDFMFVAMDQIVNQIAVARYASRGGWTAPLVIRTQQGYSPGACAQHSHSIESYLAHTPGIRVAAPSTPDDAYQMLRSAVTSDDPVVVLESRMLYPIKGDVRLDMPVEPIGGARVVKPGRDVSIVSWARGVHLANDAAEALATQGIDAEVIDLRWIAPLDFETVRRSVARTGRLAIVHEAVTTGGFGAEIAARAANECFADLIAPVIRIGSADVPMPASPVLQNAVLPSVGRIVAEIEQLISRTPAKTTSQ